PHIKMTYPDNFSNQFWTMFKKLPTIQGTHFEDSNNMTTELPKIVNDFDTYLELATPGQQSKPSKYVKTLLEDLNLASCGLITPIEGMNRFFKVMQSFFDDFKTT